MSPLRIERKTNSINLLDISGAFGKAGSYDEYIGLGGAFFEIRADKIRSLTGLEFVGEARIVSDMQIYDAVIERIKKQNENKYPDTFSIVTLPTGNYSVIRKRANETLVIDLNLNFEDVVKIAQARHILGL